MACKIPSVGDLLPLYLSYHTSWYGQILYEHIGTIRSLVDGESFHEFNLAARLAALHLLRQVIYVCSNLRLHVACTMIDLLV